jgi:SAM-dependent methyltransferase
MLSRLGMRIAHGVQARLHRHVIDAGYDRQNHVETDGVHLPQELGLTGDQARDAHEYLATPTSVFRRMVHALPVDFHRFVFVDLGSGKGRILMMAAEMPFQRIEGIELSPELHRTALKNVAARAARGSNIIPRNMDATEYEFPPEPFVIYLFHPFEETVAARVLENLRQSLRRMPREGYILYLNAKYRSLFDSTDFLEPIPRSTLARSFDRIVSPWPVALYRTRLS